MCEFKSNMKYAKAVGADISRPREVRNRKSTSQPINIIFDGPPGPQSGRFIEVETDDGKSINSGTWIELGEGLWALRIESLPQARKGPEKEGE